jgi:coenzyme F420-reducing hydrogenase alpha subunit
MIEMAFRAYDPCFACATHIINKTYPKPLLAKEKIKGTEK